MSFRGTYPPRTKAGLLYTPTRMGWHLVLLLPDGQVESEALLGAPALRIRNGIWRMLPQTHYQDLMLALRDIDLSSFGGLMDFNLEPVPSNLVLTWPGGVDGHGIMMDYSMGAIWMPLEILAADP